MAASGHEIGNHTFDHIDVQHERNDGVVRDQLARTSEAIERACDVAPRLVRPPYGKDPCRTARIGASLDLSPCVLWSTMVWDWDPSTEASWIVERALSELRPGTILLMHDGAPPYDDSPRDATVEAVSTLVPELVARGYDLVTVSALLAVP
jgi:peptidoglycan/xylan/chitin deacetylase (PgdA/CDA1 family)